ncbi:methylated-DNA--[protein]-cysteine S-methyltransferase [Paenibacillus hamazuiensis]|uniref:methylated-DNA--[protein]-cysteine S-methyltransferase n=1 Tax=Paenibacillus hamazuiensis TaxID=2936508 RepID=UPI00200C30EB|nr:methylated-DNA--[protein]-cysteine S-methyltransferase [Paenibacillus hamazuiensis]
MGNGNRTEVYWTSFRHPVLQNRTLYLAATDRGVCRITLPNESFETLQSWANKKIPNPVLIEECVRLSEYIKQLSEYFDGHREAFDFPLDLRGTAFQTNVWGALTRIPYGEVRSYSDIAEAVGSPEAVRAVGTANGANPVPIVVPCHRVIGKSSALTGFRGGLQVKTALLHLEGFRDFIPQGHARFRF